MNDIDPSLPWRASGLFTGPAPDHMKKIITNGRRIRENVSECGAGDAQIGLISVSIKNCRDIDARLHHHSAGILIGSGLLYEPSWRSPPNFEITCDWLLEACNSSRERSKLMMDKIHAS